MFFNFRFYNFSIYHKAFDQYEFIGFFEFATTIWFTISIELYVFFLYAMHQAYFLKILIMMQPSATISIF